MKDDINILKTMDLYVGYPGKNILPVYGEINIDAKKGEIVAALGQNGIGKSTLLRTMARLQQPMGGKILLKDHDIEDCGRIEMAKSVSFVSTEIIQISNMTLFELIALGRFPYTNWLGRLDQKDNQLIREAIHLVGLDHLTDKNINEVSDGERQRAMIARTLAQDTEIIILDEPTAFLDLPNKYEIIHLLSELSRHKEKTIIFSTHDLNIALQEADKIWLMLPDGIVTGSPEDLILTHSFKPVFENTKLQFDEQKGEIRMKRESGYKINFQGDGITGIWTRRALERLGFTISEKAYTDTSVRVRIDDNKPIWCLEKNEKIFEFNSIYDLSLRLKKTN